MNEDNLLMACRQEIDKIDREIVDLFVRRMDVSSRIAGYKKEHALPVWDPTREKEKLSAVQSASPEELRPYAAALYTQILSLSRSRQMLLNGGESGIADVIRAALEKTPSLFPESACVACQGVEGANSQFACEKLFSHPDIMFFSGFDAVFSAIEKGLCRYGIVPVENSTAGTVKAVYDLMMDHRFYIVRSVRLKVDHDLLARPGAVLQDIREIYSHEQAIGQCSHFLSTLRNVRVIPCENTAAAAKMVAASDRGDVAALANPRCTEYYPLARLVRAVQNNNSNYTRFICISREPEIYPGADRTSLMLTLPHKPGALCRLLGSIAALDVNLTKLESRPLPGSDFEFMFYFDMLLPVYSPKLTQLMAELPVQCERFSYLGSYSEVF